MTHTVEWHGAQALSAVPGQRTRSRTDQLAASPQYGQSAVRLMPRQALDPAVNRISRAEEDHNSPPGLESANNSQETQLCLHSPNSLVSNSCALTMLTAVYHTFAAADCLSYLSPLCVIGIKSLTML